MLVLIAVIAAQPSPVHAETRTVRIVLLPVEGTTLPDQRLAALRMAIEVPDGYTVAPQSVSLLLAADGALSREASAVTLPAGLTIVGAQATYATEVTMPQDILVFVVTGTGEASSPSGIVVRHATIILETGDVCRTCHLAVVQEPWPG